MSSFVPQINARNASVNSADNILPVEALSRLRKVRRWSWRLREVSNRVTKLSLVLHEGEHHQHVASAMYKATTGPNVELSKLS
jgi:hypothetical protein